MHEIDNIIVNAVFSSKGDAIVAADRRGAITFWNLGAERIFGYSSDDAVGRSLDIIIPARLRQRHWAGYRKVIECGNSRYAHGDILAVPGVTRDGRRISLEFTVLPLLSDDGAIRGLAAILREVTARFDEIRALRKRLQGASEAVKCSQ
jgi:PAS domain S-box-containing protein